MRILVIEDETKVGCFIKRALEEESYAVDLCEDGAKGLEMALHTNYDLLIVDLMLPSLPGLDILKGVRQARIQTPILILTAQSQVDQRVKGLDAGADDYLTKPFAIDELLARIRALLRRGSTESPGVLQIDDLGIEPGHARSDQRRPADRPHLEGICPARIFDAPYGTRVDPSYDFRTCVEPGLRHVHQCHRCLRELSPQQDRPGALKEADSHYSRKRIYAEGRLMPLRVRLTLWYGTALALILIIFSTILYVITARSLHDAVDESLEETAAAAVRSLEERGFLPLIDEDELMSQFPELARIDKFFQIFSPSGTITIRSPNMKQHEMPLSRQALEVAYSGRSLLEFAKYPKEPPLRLISVPIIYRGSLLYIIQVGTSMDSVEETLNRLLLVLLVSMPIALAVSLAGGWFMAGRALRPVDAITLAAQRIAGGDLTQRLTVPASADEIGRLTKTFNDMIDRLETSFRQIRQFSSDASHELRTPLTVMKGETELALRRPRETDDYKVVLESNLEEIDRMTRIVDELLFLSRADMGEVKMERLPVPLDTLVEDLHRQASLLGQERDIQVVLRTTAPAVVLGDELRLRELFLNLLDNAVKYSRPGGTVDIALTIEQTHARVSVTDHGIGIAQEDQSRIFDRFYRTDEARAHTKKGTGLGLAICAWIVESHRGRIEVQSKVGEGSTFTVMLPLAPASAAAKRLLKPS